MVQEKKRTVFDWDGVAPNVFQICETEKIDSDGQTIGDVKTFIRLSQIEFVKQNTEEIFDSVVQIEIGLTSSKVLKFSFKDEEECDDMFNHLIEIVK